MTPTVWPWLISGTAINEPMPASSVCGFTSGLVVRFGDQHGLAFFDHAAGHAGAAQVRGLQSPVTPMA